MARKTNLRINRNNFKINCIIRTSKLSSENLTEKPEIVRKDVQSGDSFDEMLDVEKVRRVSEDADDKNEGLESATGEALPRGTTTYDYVNEEGEIVPTEDIVRFQVSGVDEPKQVEKHDPTIGSERKIKPIKWVSIDEIDEFHIEKIYEVWGDDDDDSAQLLELAEYIADNGEAPVIEWVYQPTWTKSWAIITPSFEDDQFSIIARITSKKVDAKHEMSMNTEEIREEMGEEVAETIDQDSPF